MSTLQKEGIIWGPESQMISLTSLSCQVGELHSWKAFYYCLLPLENSGLEYDSRPKLSFAKQNSKIQKNDLKVFSLWSLFSPTLRKGHNNQHHPAWKGRRHSFPFLLLSSILNFEWKNSFSKDTIRQKNRNTRIDSKRWTPEEEEQWIMISINPEGSKLSQSFLVAKAKREICCIPWLSLSIMERSTSSLGNISFFKITLSSERS